MCKQVKYFQCKNCGFVISPLDVKYAKTCLLEYCPRCHDYPHPFKQVLEKREENG